MSPVRVVALCRWMASRIRHKVPPSPRRRSGCGRGSPAMRSPVNCRCGRTRTQSCSRRAYPPTGWWSRCIGMASGDESDLIQRRAGSMMPTAACFPGSGRGQLGAHRWDARRTTVPTSGQGTGVLDVVPGARPVPARSPGTGGYRHADADDVVTRPGCLSSRMRVSGLVLPPPAQVHRRGPDPTGFFLSRDA